MTVVGGPSGSTLRVSSPIDGTDVRAGDFVASINGVRRFASARHASRVVSNFRVLGRPVRLVCIRSPSSGAAYRARSSLAASSPINPLGEATKHTTRPPDCPVQLERSHAVGSPLPPSVLSTVQLDGAPSLGIPEVLDAAQMDDAPSLGIPTVGVPLPPVLSAVQLDDAPSVGIAAIPSASQLSFTADGASGLAQRLLVDIRSSPSLAGALSSRGVFEVCAGRGTLSRSYEDHGFSPWILSETDSFDRRCLQARFPRASVVGDFFHRHWQQPAPILVATGGVSCVFVSPAGQQLGTNDERAPITTDALPWAASYFRSPFANFENVPGIATADQGSVLRALDGNFHKVGYERVPLCAEFPAQLEIARPNLVGAPGVRDRAVGHYEWLGLSQLIGPCPRLALKHTEPYTISDILDVGPRDPSLIVSGNFTPVVPDLSNPRFPITAGFLTTGGPTQPIAVGSRVTANILRGVPWVIWSFLSGTRVLLFFDSRQHPEWLEFDVTTDLPFGDTLVHLEWTERVLDVRGVANATTSFGVPYVGCAKQLWLVHGQVASPSVAELWRIQEYDTDDIAAYQQANSGFLHDPRRTKLLRSMPGKGLSARLADAVAARTADRARLLAAVARGDIEPFSSSLELALSRSQLPFAPVDDSVVTFALVVTWIGGQPRVLANAVTGSLPAVVSAANEPRSAATRHVDGLFRSARPGSTPPVSFLVDDWRWCRLVAVPLQHNPSQLSFGPLAWHTLRDLEASSLRLPAYRALATVAAFLGDSARPTLPPPALPGGARAPEYVPQSPPVLAVNASTWSSQLRLSARANDTLRTILRADDGADATYYHEWADQIHDIAPDAVPPNLRGALEDFSDSKFANAPMAYRDAIPLTVPAPEPPLQQSQYRPRSVTPDIFPQAVADRWALWWPRVLKDLLAYKANPEVSRSFNTPFVVSQSEMHPSARGIFWDLRSRDRDGAFSPLDFSPSLNTHLDVEYLASEWEDFPDQEMVYMITHTGVDFKISHVANQTVIFPHLESLAAGFCSVEKELRRLNKLGFNDFFESFPFLPWCALANGATARKLEERMRRTTEPGAPRNFLADKANDEVVALNKRIGAKDIVTQAGYLFPNQPTTTGHLTHSAAVAAHSSAKPYKATRWPKEVKPRVEDFLHDLCVLKHAAAQLGEEVFVFTSDAKDFFNQLKLAPWCLPHVGLLWTALHDEHANFTCVAEYSLGFGFSCASNIAQRFSNGILDIFRRHFDLADAADIAGDRAAAPEYFAARDSLSRLTGRNEGRLMAVHMYTDDPVFIVVGALRAKRLLSVWRSVTAKMNLTMAIAAKHKGGVAAEWLGLLQLAQLGALAVPLPKHAAALREVRALIAGDSFSRERYHSIVGLLEHLLVYANGNRSAMSFLYYPIKQLGAAGPTTKVTINDDVVRQFRAWESRLSNRAGISATAVFARADFLSHAALSAPGIEYIVSTDAAAAGTSRPGIGGFCHGHRFSVALADSDVRGPYKIPIPVLEFIGIGFAVAAFHPVVADAAACVTFGSDSITSVDAVLNDSANADLMQIVHDGLVNLPEYESLRPRMRLGHKYGEGNVWADAESRGYTEVLAQLAAQLGIRPVTANVPVHALVLLDRVRAAVRQRPLTQGEDGRTAAYKQNSLGDGPVSLAIFSSVGVRLTPPVQLTVDGSVPPAGVKRPATGAPSLAVVAPRAAKAKRVLSVLARGLVVAAGQSLDVVLPVAARAPAMPRVSVANARNQIVDVLARDNSSFALRATDQHWAASLALDINQCVHDSVPDSTLAKDTFAWKEWMRHCDKFNTVAWRPDRNDLDSVGRARERFLFDSFLIEDYKRMVRNKPTAKPRSAVNNLLAVKRVFRRGGVMPTGTPNTNTILRGLLNRYVLLHGAEVLTPKRVEPLINSDMQGIFGVRDGVRCGSVTVHWSSPRFRSFRAYLSTARIAAYRKAGVLCVNSGDFDLRSASRGHLSWRYHDQMRTHLTDGELRSLRPGDCAVITPVPVKNDPFAEFFGNHPIWLPYDSADPFNAACWLADLELAFPIPAE